MVVVQYSRISNQLLCVLFGSIIDHLQRLGRLEGAATPPDQNLYLISWAGLS